MGWANHDHHTFRSSRALFIIWFVCLRFRVSLPRKILCRQGSRLGSPNHGKQRCRLVLFLDVDLAPEEIDIDFAHHELHELDSLGTVGLWCALHGDSISKPECII